ncbi:MAG: SpoIIE family protein phosphatase [Candidatus Aquicultor sp.]
MQARDFGEPMRQAELELIIETIPDAVVVVSRSGRIFFANRAAETVLGLSRSEITARTYNAPEWKFTTVDGKPYPEGRLPFDLVIKDGKPVYEIELAIGRPDGKRVILSVNAAPIHDAKGSIVSVVNSFTDITKRKTAEFALQESEARFRAIFEQSIYGIGMGTPDGRFVLYNRALEAIFGYTKDEINSAGGWLYVLYPDPAERAQHKEFDMSILRGQLSYVEYTVTRKDGRKIWVSSSAIPVTIRGQVYLLGITQDITQRKQAEELSDALNNINAAIIATLDPDEIMDTVFNESAKAIGAEQTALVLREGNYWVYKHIHGAPRELLGARLTDEEIRFAGVVVETQRPVVSDDAFNDKRFGPEYMRRAGIRSFLAVPLVAHGNVIGLLYHTYLLAQKPFTPAQVDFVAKLGTATSLALENARLYEIKRDVADTMQETLLTVPAHIDGIEFSHLYRAATEVARVGGDFYDIFPLKENKVGIAVGDIAGTGVQAAILATMVKNAIRAYSYEDNSPAQVMAKTNELVQGTTGPGLFVTAFFGILDIETGRLIYCSAGHPPAILKRKTGEAALLITSSPILGAFPALNFIDDEETVNQDDAVVLYTDGVTEARCRSGKFFGEEQLVMLMKNLPASVPVKDIPKVILGSVIECAGGTIADDIVVLSFGLANP